MRILFATTLIPAAEGSGGEVVSHAIVRAMEQLGHRVIVAGFQRPGDAPPAANDAIVIDRRPIETADSGLRAIGWLARSVASGMPYTSAKFFSNRYGPLLRDCIERECIDAIVLDHTQMLWLIDWLPSGMPVAIVMHNAESELYARGAPRLRSPGARLLYRREANLLRKVETGIASRADRIWVLSEEDAARIRPHVGAAAVSVLPVMPDWPVAPPPDPAFDIALLATWTWRPNAEALNWFLDNVYPRLPREVTIHVAGPGAEWLRDRYPNVVQRGFVEDAAAFLRAARLIAVPTRYGSGLETKMLAAISAGSAIVATSASIRGLDGVPATVAVADEAESFAHCVVDRLALRASSAIGRKDALAWRAARRRNFLAVLGRDLSLLAPGADFDAYERKERMRGAV